MKSVKTKAMALGICITLLVAMGVVIVSTAAIATDQNFEEMASGGIQLQSSHTGTWNYDLDLYSGILWIGTTEGISGPGIYYDTIGVQLGDLMILTTVRPGWDTYWFITDIVRWDFGTMKGTGRWINDGSWGCCAGYGIQWWIKGMATSTQPYDSTGDMDTEMF